MYMRNIADIWTDIRIADILELGDICEAVLNGGE